MHCDPNDPALHHALMVTETFNIVCDTHPLREGHILIIPKKHIACVGAFDDETFAEYKTHVALMSRFIRDSYDNQLAVFEHGVVGQTVFHAHTHLLPYTGTPESIVPEGITHCTKIFNVEAVRDLYAKDGKYLYFSIRNDEWVVDTTLGAPRFFRDRFARVMSHSNRGNWQEMQQDSDEMDIATSEIEDTKRKWRQWETRPLRGGSLNIV